MARHWSEDRLLDYESLVEALEALSDGVVIYGPDERPLFINQAHQRRFPIFCDDLARGATAPEAMEGAVRRHMKGESEDKIHKTVARLVEGFRSGKPISSRGEDGSILRTTYRPMSGDRKAGISVDVSELEAARRQAESASASKSAFLANMSHEIRTPLNGVMGMAQVLEGGDLSDAQREHVAIIIESGKTLMALLNDVLDLSKIEAGKFDIVPSDANFTHVLRRQLKLWRPRAEEKGLDLSLSFDADLPAWLAFDQVRVQQCVSNLVSNAIKFTKQGRIDIFATSRELTGGEHLVEIRIADTGAGMDEATLARLFKPFAQADETISRQHGGTGLGLSITRRLAELMGGTASAESAPGKGSTFRISFAAKVAKATDEPLVAPDSGDIRALLKTSNLRVLLVDDHPINRQVASLFLRPFNMRIREATNGAEALAALGEEAFDVVLLDMHMPVMDGPATICRIRESGASWSDLPVIALTADAMSGDRERYLAMGMDGYLSKPLSERDLLSEISRVRSGAVHLKLARAG